MTITKMVRDGLRRQRGTLTPVQRAFLTAVERKEGSR